MITTMLQLIVIVAIFVILSGLMAVTETAILSVSRAKVEAMLRNGRRGAASLARTNKDVNRSGVVMVAITNTINVLGPALVGMHAVELYGNSAIGVATALLTFATIVFSEINQESLGTQYAPRTSLIFDPPSGSFFLPVVVGLHASS